MKRAYKVHIRNQHLNQWTTIIGATVNSRKEPPDPEEEARLAEQIVRKVSDDGNLYMMAHTTMVAPNKRETIIIQAFSPSMMGQLILVCELQEEKP